MITNLPAWFYVLILFVLLILSGIAEYIHLVPSGTFNTVLLVAIGLIAPSPAFNHVHVDNSSSSSGLSGTGGPFNG